MNAAKTLLIGATLAAICGSAWGQARPDAADRFRDVPGIGSPGPVLRIDQPPVQTTLLATGEAVTMPAFAQWRPMCGSKPGALTLDDLRRIAADHETQFADPGRVIVVDNGKGDAGINIIFSLGSGVPSAAIPAFAAAESYLETLFSDPITVPISVSFAALSPGVIGATGSNFVSSSYTNSRNGLINGRDPTDTIQTSLPASTSVQARFSSSLSSSSVGSIVWTVANANATLAPVSGSAARMQFSTNFSFDWNPVGGVGGSQISFQDVVVHEVGHALGFVSAVDFSPGSVYALDLFRFQRSQQNPATTTDFTNFARFLSRSPTDDAISDIISGEWRMADGVSWQASHFREQGTPIGIMDPAFAPGQTFYPNFMRTSDLSMFDAIGYDYPPSSGGCTTPAISRAPQPVTVCLGQPFSLTVVATGTDLSYEWRRGATVISGATGPTYSVAAATAGDAGSYTARVFNTCGSITSSAASVGVGGGPVVTEPPQPVTACVGGTATFTVGTQGTGLTYQWFRTDTGQIAGATASTLRISPVQAADEATYFCRVSSSCGFTISQSATLTLGTLPGFTTQPASVSARVGDRVELFGLATGSDPISYQWLKDGTIVQGATGNRLIIASVLPEDAGRYVLSATNPCSTSFSQTATLTVLSACRVDCNEDGTLNIADFTCFQNVFALGDLDKADLTGDGVLDVQDFAAFQNQFALGCP